MGGKKKLSLKQMERMQMRKGEEEKKRKEKEKEKATKEKKPAGIFLPDVQGGKILDELKKMRVLTPYAVATRLNIRISAAKDFLEKLEEDGLVQLVSGNHDIKIYKAVD
ncbi:MAG: helix-turn-helix domain-containing protein [Candidatus Bathyarchaeia archaeon]